MTVRRHGSLTGRARFHVRRSGLFQRIAIVLQVETWRVRKWEYPYPPPPRAQLERGYALLTDEDWSTEWRDASPHEAVTAGVFGIAVQV